jgi:hypothetical protein
MANRDEPLEGKILVVLSFDPANGRRELVGKQRYTRSSATAQVKPSFLGPIY